MSDDEEDGSDIQREYVRACEAAIGLILDRFTSRHPLTCADLESLTAALNTALYTHTRALAFDHLADLERARLDPD